MIKLDFYVFLIFMTSKFIKIYWVIKKLNKNLINNSIYFQRKNIYFYLKKWKNKNLKQIIKILLHSKLISYPQIIIYTQRNHFIVY